MKPLKIAVTALMLAILSSLSYSQDSAREIDEFMQARHSAKELSTVTWQKGAPGSDVSYKDGKPIKRLTVGSIDLSVTKSVDWGKTVITLGILNLGFDQQRFEITPDDVTLRAGSGQDAKEFLHDDPAKMARSAYRWAAISAGLSQAGAGMRTQTATGTTSSGERVTITQPDAAAQRQAKAESDANLSATDEAGSILISRSLKRNTIAPGESVIGNIYFKRQKKDFVVVVKIAGTVFEIPFSGKGDE